MIRLTNESFDGSFNNVTINSNVNELIDVLGTPQYNRNNGSNKVNFEWSCITECERKIKFYIYDWNLYHKLSLDKNIEFHIGGKNFEETSYARELLLQMIKDNNECVNLIGPDEIEALNELRDINNDKDLNESTE